MRRERQIGQERGERGKEECERDREVGEGKTLQIEILGQPFLLNYIIIKNNRIALLFFLSENGNYPTLYVYFNS